MSATARRQMFQDFERWGFDEKGWSATTRHRYRLRAESADEWLLLNRGRSLMWATAQDLKAYLFSTSANARNRNHIRQALVGFGNYAMSQGYTESNQALALPRLPEPESLPKPVSPEVARRIDIVARTLPLMDQVLVLTYLYAGLRKTEGRLLEWACFDDELRWILVTGKRNKERPLPVHDDLRPALHAWRAQTTDARWVFPSPRRAGTPVSDSYVKRVIWDVGELVMIDHLHPHQLRHTFATAILDAGGDLVDAQVALGHVDPKTTTIYAKLRPARLQAGDRTCQFPYSGGEFMKRLLLVLTAFVFLLTGCPSDTEAFPCQHHHRVATVQNFQGDQHSYTCQDGHEEFWEHGEKTVG